MLKQKITNVSRRKDGSGYHVDENELSAQINMCKYFAEFTLANTAHHKYRYYIITLYTKIT